jgi:hypothetical protein
MGRADGRDRRDDVRAVVGDPARVDAALRMADDVDLFAPVCWRISRMCASSCLPRTVESLNGSTAGVKTCGSPWAFRSASTLKKYVRKSIPANVWNPKKPWAKTTG